jgi:hypothetical protein
MKKHVQVFIDGEPVYDERVDSGEICYTHRDGRINLMAGPGTALRFLGSLIGVC